MTNGQRSGADQMWLYDTWLPDNPGVDHQAVAGGRSLPADLGKEARSMGRAEKKQEHSRSVKVAPAGPDCRRHTANDLMGGAPATRRDSTTKEGSRLADYPPVLTVPELAGLLRISRANAYRLVRDGDLPGVRRVGRSIRILTASVLSWLDQGRDSLEGETKL